jgi:hypothetical protein
MNPSYEAGYYDTLIKLGLYQMAEAHMEKSASDAGMDKEAFKQQIGNFFSKLIGRGAMVPGTQVAKSSPHWWQNLKSIATGQGRRVRLPTDSGLAARQQAHAAAGYSPTRAVPPTAPTPGGVPGAGGTPATKPGFFERFRNWRQSRQAARAPQQQAATTQPTRQAPSTDTSRAADDAFAGRPRTPADAAMYAEMDQALLSGAAGGGAKPWTLGRKLKWGAGLGGGGLLAYNMLGGQQGGGAQAGPRQQYSDPYMQQMMYR